MKRNVWLAAGAINMLVAVAAGAFGAHGLKAILSTDMLAIWQTAVHYQMVHALGLIAISILLQKSEQVWVRRSGIAMLAGIVIFSGSLYLLALTGVRWLGAITPIGGVAFLAAWAMLIRAAWQPSH